MRAYLTCSIVLAVGLIIAGNVALAAILPAWAYLLLCGEAAFVTLRACECVAEIWTREIPD